MTDKNLRERIVDFDENIKLWQESYDAKIDGCNATALNDLKKAKGIISQLLEVVEMQREIFKALTKSISQAAAKVAKEALDKTNQILGENE